MGSAFTQLCGPLDSEDLTLRLTFPEVVRVRDFGYEATSVIPGTLKRVPLIILDTQD